MLRKNKGKMSTRTKKIIAGVISVCFVVGGVVIFLLNQTSKSNAKAEVAYTSINVSEGSVASSTLLSGTAKALSEQYVYFDVSKGSDATVTVAVGDQITKGQQLVQYDKTVAQAAYDMAVRNLNKIGRQINYLKTYGNLPTTSTSIDEETGEPVSQTIQPTAEQNASYNQQLQDLNDSYADAQSEINKAQDALNQTIIVSDVDGTVVETNSDIDPSAKESQTLVHIVTEGQLQVQGTLTEYDLANVHSGQSVKIKSKVYPDQEWTGTISYISNYPNPTSDAASATGSAAISTSYDYKVDLTSELGDLKQGFTVTVEVINENKNKLVPVDAIVNDKDKNYVWLYDENTSKVNKVEVTLGNADAAKQEVLTGIEVGQVIISNPNSNFKDGQKIENVTSGDTTTAGSEVSTE